MAERINNNSDSTWKAVYSDDIEKYLPYIGKVESSSLFSSTYSKKWKAEQYENLPKHFDTRHKYPMCNSTRTVRDQSYCGSCWAFGTEGAMSDRICFESVDRNEEPVQDMVSTGDITTCISYSVEGE